MGTVLRENKVALGLHAAGSVEMDGRVRSGASAWRDGKRAPRRVCPESGPWITSPAETPVLGRLERPVVDSGYVADLQSLDAFVLLLELYHRNVGSVP